MSFEIIGKDLRYGMEDPYGFFDNLKDCLSHMERLKRSWGG